VLTDGDQFRLYNTTVPVDAEEKLFCRIRLSEGNDAEALRVLNLISRRNMEDNLLDVLWGAHFVDRRVRKALQEMFATGAFAPDVQTALRADPSLITEVAVRLLEAHFPESIHPDILSSDPSRSGPPTLPPSTRPG
jgi:hypothetical protein